MYIKLHIITYCNLLAAFGSISSNLVVALPSPCFAMCYPKEKRPVWKDRAPCQSLCLQKRQRADCAALQRVSSAALRSHPGLGDAQTHDRARTEIRKSLWETQSSAELLSLQKLTAGGGRWSRIVFVFASSVCVPRRVLGEEGLSLRKGIGNPAWQASLFN